MNTRNNKIIAVGVLVIGLCVGVADAALIINFDLGANVNNTGANQVIPKTYGTVDYDGNSSGDVWNQMGSAPGGIQYGGVQDIAGNAVPGAWFTLNQVTDKNSNDGSAPSAVQWANAIGVPNEVLPSLYYDNPGTPLMDFAIGGLTPGSVWDVEVFAVVNNTHTVDFTINGQTVDNHDRTTFFTSGDPNDAKADFAGVVANGSGQLVLTLSDNHGGWPVVQAMRLTLIPAPAALPAGLALLGLVGLGRRRRG